MCIITLTLTFSVKCLRLFGLKLLNDFNGADVNLVYKGFPYSKTCSFLELLISALLILSSILLITTFPTLSLESYLILALALIAIYINRYAWLYIVPLFAIAINLTTYTGRVVITELDIFLFFSCGILIYKNGMRHSSLIIKALAIGLFIYLFYISATNHFNALFQPLTTNYYFTTFFSTSIIKGIWWASILTLILQSQFHRNNTKTLSNFFLSSCVSSICLFLIILWERRFFGGLFSDSSIFSLLKSFFDFTTSYRVTGLVADMHTGGESFDGMLLFLFPLNFAAIFFFKKQSLKIFAAVSACAVCYCVLVGFTRATYGAIACAAAAFLASKYYFDIKQQNTEVRPLAINVLLITVYMFAIVNLYNVAGFYSIGAGALLCFGVYYLYILSTKNNSKILWGIPIVTLFTIFILVDSFYDNAWIEHTNLQLLSLSLYTVLLIATVFIKLYLLNKQKKPMQALTYPLIAIVILSGILSVATGGSRIVERMDKITGDLNTRLTHWQSVLDSGDNSLKTVFWGNGIGTFPTNYLTTFPEAVSKLGSFSIQENNATNALELGSGADLAFGQRIDAYPGITYTLKGFYKLPKSDSKIKAHFKFQICERNLIVFEKWGQKCGKTKHLFEPTDEYKAFSIEIPSKNIGEKHWLFRQQITFLMRYYQGDDVIAFDKIELFDNYQNQILKNADFTDQMDHWFFYHDFEHLPWHIKNIYLSIYYQVGIIGGLIFLGFILMGLRNLFNCDPEYRLLYISMLSVIIGYLSFGVFGDPLDSARTNMLFFMILFMFSYPSQHYRLKQ